MALFLILTFSSSITTQAVLLSSKVEKTKINRVIFDIQSILLKHMNINLLVYVRTRQSPPFVVVFCYNEQYI